MSNSGTVGELRQRAEELRQKAKGFNAQADGLDKLADSVEEQLSQIEGGVISGKRGRKSASAKKPAAKSSEGKGRGRRGDQPSLKEVISEILKKHHGGVDLKTIVQGVLDAGYKTTGKNLSQNVSTNLHLMQRSKTVKLEDHKYSLVKAA